MGSNPMYSLTWGEFSNCLSSTVQSLRGDNEMVDVTVAAGGKVFPAHKLILSAASPLLMRMLKSTQCSHPVLMLAGITAADMEALLQFVYLGQVCVQSTQLPSLLQAAHFLDIQALSPQALTGKVYKEHSPTQSEAVAGPSTPTVHRDVSTSPQLPVRKRRRKQTNNSDQEDFRWPPSLPTEAEITQTQMEETLDDQDDSCKKLVSDLPVECTICGQTIRQSRNLRRHMELIHLKLDNDGKLKKHPTKEENIKFEEETNLQSASNISHTQVQVHRTVKSVQTSVQSVQTMTRVCEGSLDQPGPSRLAVQSGQMLTSPSHISSQPQTTHTPKLLTSHILIASSPSIQVPNQKQHILTQNPQMAAPQVVSSHVSTSKVHSSHSVPLNPQIIPMLGRPPKHLHVLTPPASSQNPMQNVSHIPTQKGAATHVASASSQIPVSHVANVKIPSNHLVTSPPPTSQMVSPQLLTPHILTSSPNIHVSSQSPTTALSSPPLYQTLGSSQTVPYPHANLHSMQFSHNNINDATFRQHQVDMLRNAGLYADTREHCSTE